MSLSNQEDFIKKLQSEVTFQSQLEKKQLLPKKLGWLGRIIANYSWQVLLIISGVTALVRALVIL
jgi:hypothetical protein